MSEQPKLLVIELDSISSVPKVIFKGEEVKRKVRVDFSWQTPGFEKVMFESPYIRIESAETGEPALLVQGYNESPYEATAQQLVDAITEGFKHLPSAADIIEAYEKRKKSFVDDDTKDDSYTGKIDLAGRQYLKKHFVNDGE